MSTIVVKLVVSDSAEIEMSKCQEKNVTYLADDEVIIESILVMNWNTEYPNVTTIAS